ncbi:MAG: BMP family ABC transporter substrate-binding protein [Clostridia bacterium]|nr:BMP family ABC transporter substrate-binding protein [Clostridia bacterium]
MKKILSMILALTMIAGVIFLASCSGNETTKKGESDPLLPAPKIEKFAVSDDFKIGLICLHDENSTYDNNFIKGLKEVKEALGLKDEQVIIKVNIPESNECYDAAVDCVNKGCKIVFADSFGHESFMAQAAADYPNVEFCHATGTSAATRGLKNFHNAFASVYQVRYLAGIAAGMKLNEMISDGKITADQAIIGYVGAFTYAEVISGMTSFFLGARSVCPSATMKVRYTGSWYDQAFEQEAANALITTDKCVLISQHADSLGAPTACELAGVPNVSYNGSTYSAGESTFLISSAINWAPYYAYIIKCVQDGTEIPANWTGNIETGSVVLSGVNLDVIAEGTEKAIADAIAKFKAGTLHVFDTKTFSVTGNPNAVVDQDGHLVHYNADVDGDYVPDTDVVHDGYFDESGADFRSAPFFDIRIDGVTFINEKY